MSKLAITTTVAGLLLLPGVSAAHPGHGAEFGLLHYLTDPFHLAGAVLIAAAGVVLVALARRLSRRSPLRDRRSG